MAAVPESVKVQQWPKPVASIGQVLILVKAFGLSHSEISSPESVHIT